MNRKLIIIISLAVLLISAAFAFCAGRYEMKAGEVFEMFSAVISGKDISDNASLSNLKLVIFEIRLPRIAAALFVGSSLAIAGALMQGVFVNPLVSPKIMGVLSGASFGAAFGMLCFTSWVFVQLSSFAFGILGALLALLISRIYKSTSVLLLVLGGMISGAFFDALLSFVKLIADPNDQLAAIIFWLMGSLAIADNATVLFAGIPAFIVTVGLCFFGKALNVLSMGDDEAMTMGLNAGRMRIIILLLATFVSSLAVVMAGNIGWVGLIIPHIARMTIGPDNRYLLPLSAIFGGIFLLAADTVTRTVFTSEIPLGIITSIIGLPVFAFILKNTHKGWK